MLNTTLDQKKILVLVSTAVKETETCFGTATESASTNVLGMLMPYFGAEDMSALVGLGASTTTIVPEPVPELDDAPAGVIFDAAVATRCQRANKDIVEKNIPETSVVINLERAVNRQPGFRPENS